MHSVYEELLSFEGLDEAVNRLYKAYLDMRLLEFEDATKPVDATKNTPAKPANDAEYWRRVKDFRKKALDPYTELASPAAGDDEDTDAARASRRELVAKATDEFEKAKEQFEYARAFLYWYDIRAEAWVNNRPNHRIRELLVPAAELESLHRQAQELEKRLVDAERHARHHGRTFQRSAGAKIMINPAQGPPANKLMPIVAAVEKGSKPPGARPETTQGSPDR